MIKHFKIARGRRVVFSSRDTNGALQGPPLSIIWTRTLVGVASI